jgi:hypothetical protein
MSAEIIWQFKHNSNDLWYNFEARTSAMFEGSFLTSTTRICTIKVRGPDGSVTEKFDVHKMLWGPYKVRRCPLRMETGITTCVEFWDDHAWEPYDIYEQCLFNKALELGRENVRIHLDTASYDIVLRYGYYMQTNISTGRMRPLRVRGSIAYVEIDDDDEEEIVDDPNMPNEYRCPITQMPMIRPVMLMDGHTYERDAIQKWLLLKNTSPVTGQTLSNNSFYVNHALRKLIRDWKVASEPVEPEALDKLRDAQQDNADIEAYLEGALAKVRSQKPKPSGKRTIDVNKPTKASISKKWKK